MVIVSIKTRTKVVNKNVSQGFMTLDNIDSGSHVIDRVIQATDNIDDHVIDIENVFELER